MKLVLLKNYNNYFNRIVKKDEMFKNIQQYEPLVIPNINFNEKDGVNTTQVVNIEKSEYDYLAVLKDSTIIPTEIQKKLVIDGGSYIEIYDHEGESEEYTLNEEPGSLINADYKAYINTKLVIDNHLPTEDTSYYMYIQLNDQPAQTLKISTTQTEDFNITISGYDKSTGYGHSYALHFRDDDPITFERLKDLGCSDDYQIQSFNLGHQEMMDGERILNLTFEVIPAFEEFQVESRWFITEDTKNRNGQYVLQLKRDLLVDYYDQIIESPLIVNRATISDKSNPLLFNPEGFSLNQIKQSETLLKDQSGCPWYVLYFKKTMGTKEGSFTTASETKPDVTITGSIENSIYSSGTKKYYRNVVPKLRYRVETNWTSYMTFSDQYIVSVKGDHDISYSFESYSSLVEVVWFENKQSTVKSKLTPALTGQYNNLRNAILLDSGRTGGITDNQRATLDNAGKSIIVKDGDNKLYQVNITKTTENKSGTLKSGTAKDTFKNLIASTSLDRSGSMGDSCTLYSLTEDTYNVSVTEVTNNNVSWEIDFGGRETEDSDFNMIAIPALDGSKRVRLPGGAYYDCWDYVNKALINSISKKITEGEFVDIQYIPYCPFTEIVFSNFWNLEAIDAERVEHSEIGGLYKGFLMFYIRRANFTVDIPYYISNTKDALETKLDNECDLYKIVSPNYNGSFEFSPSKNGGITKFNVDVSLIPYNPYIHINPDFNNLYGSDFDDAKGLICGGDFSLPKYSNKWEEYQLNNKNYQLMFDRQVRNLDFNQKQESTLQTISAITGTVTGATSGAMTGALVGGGYGAIAGAVVGGTSSAVGGIADSIMLEQRQQEQRSLMLDNYTYQLGNIKALPDTINKVTPLTYNHKIFPFLEKYSCTDTERQLLKNYLTYQGMTVNAIGTIKEYLQEDKTFISGTLIRLEDTDLASHEVNEIYNELMKGVYI